VIDTLNGIVEELFVLFDGVLGVLRDGRKVTEVGPGAVLGELALLGGGRRTATLRAVTPCRVAVVPGDRVARGRLDQVASQHGRTTACAGLPLHLTSWAAGRSPDATDPGVEAVLDLA
jgi:CRP-like cAMP-binding protein